MQLQIQHFTKTCTKCKEIKRFNEYGNFKAGRFGIRPECKKCKLNIDRKYIENNNEKVKISKNKYKKNNRDKILKKGIEYRENNKDIIKESNRKWLEKRPNYKKEYYNTKIGKSSILNSNHKRRTITKKGDIESSDILLLQQNTKVCYWCQSSIKNKLTHIDHYIPLAKGGEHTLSNIVITCPKCNLSKSSKDPIIFANSIGKLL